MAYINETNEVPIVAEYDIIVVGGGIAAMGAALGARRNGLKVLVIEKSVVLGGLATLGFIAYYLPLCDGKGKKVTGGIAEELLHLSIKYGYGKNRLNRIKGVTRYLLKSADEETSSLLAITPRPDKAGMVRGKRVGTSQNLGRGSRATNQFSTM